MRNATAPAEARAEGRYLQVPVIVAPQPQHPSSLTVAQRHRARRLAYANGGLWAIGNGLVSGMLIVYLALELGGPRLGLGVSLLLAAPQLAGLLRLGAPALCDWLGDRRRFCLGAYAASALVLMALPLVVTRRLFPSAGMALSALVILWCLYHLLEYLGTVALWSWLADLTPTRVRGRFWGYRERWMVTGQALAMLAAGLFAWAWPRWFPQQPSWASYVVPAVLGSGLLLTALVPLAAIPNLAGQGLRSRPGESRGVLVPLADRRFWGLLAFGCWFSFFNGVTQAAQNIYPAKILGFSLLAMHLLKIGMRGGQFFVSPALGRLADRHGNRAVLLGALPLVAAGLLCYALATPERPGWLVGAWVLWIAYAGLNVGLPNLILKLAPTGASASYVATYQAITGLCMALSTIVGGLLQDAWAGSSFALDTGRLHLDYYAAIFLLGWISRTAGVGLLWLVREPHGAWQNGTPKGR